MSAIDLEIGERLKTLAGTTVVESRRKRDEPETVYNIEVEGDHCYRVGESGVLVHNNSADPCDCLPTVEFSLSGSMPDVAANIQAAQQAGHPNLLHRITSRSAIRRNRRQACGSVTCASGESCDEYPFASSQEGGTGARTQCVPAGQQNSQGGTLSSFYSSNGIGDGDSYCVKVVQ